MEIKSIDAGDTKSCFVDEEGEVWFCGRKQAEEVINTPTKIFTELPPILAVSSKSAWSLFLDEEGSVWHFRPSSVYDPRPHSLGIPSKISFCDLPQIISISTGCFLEHSLMLDVHGCVWSFGDNEHGELGVGDRYERDDPEKIPNLPPIRKIHAGKSVSFFIDADGFVWGAGNNSSGQLGIGTRQYKNERSPVKNPYLQKIKEVAGADGSLFLDESGRVWACGFNATGNLGLGDTQTRKVPELIKKIPKIKCMASSTSHSIFVDMKGVVWTCGMNNYGQTGQKKPVKKPTKLSDLPPIVACSAGADHSILLDEDHTVWVFGRSEYGKLGLGECANVLSPTKLESLPPIAINAVNTSACRVKSARKE